MRTPVHSIHLRLLLCPALLLLMGLGGIAPEAQAGPRSASNRVLALLPAEAGQVNFLDTESLRRSPHYAEIKARLLPKNFRQFERYLAWAGIDIDRDVESLCWSLVAKKDGSAEMVGLVEGDFHPARAQRFFEQQKLPLAEYQGHTIFPFGSGTGRDETAFLFLDESAAAFGTRATIERLIDIRAGRSPGLERNEALLRPIKEVNGKSAVWIVMDSEFARRGLGQLLPESSTFPDFRRAASRIDTATLQLDVEQNLESQFRAYCRTTVDAHFFWLVMQVALAAQRWKYKDEKPELARVIDNTTVTATGARLDITTRVDAQTLTHILRAHTTTAER